MTNKATSASEITDRLNGRLGLGGDLTVRTVQEMIEKGKRSRLERGEFITLRGQTEPKFCVLLSGVVRLTAFTEDGREMLGLVLHPGDCWGVNPCLGNFPETNDTVVESAAEVLILSKAEVDALMWSRIDFQRAMIKLLCNRLNLAVSVAEQLGAWTAKERLAWRLLLLARDRAPEPGLTDRLEIQISQESLGAMLHLSRQHTNTILKELERDALIRTGYGRICVIDPDGLADVFQYMH
jgi:CRP/FNR family transcriptional regulator, cyclic AMP receptor protein